MTLTFGSLFAGIGGFDLGLERAGMECRWQVEIDPWCQKVLAKHWPDVKRHGDIRDVGKHNLEPVDVICGGFPCQDVSLAGERLGLKGERSTLWTEFERIIGEIQPKWVVIENVRGLLSSDNGRFFERVMWGLSSNGYDAEWITFPAAAIGAPHIRDRVFILAYPRGKFEDRTVLTRNSSASSDGYQVSKIWGENRIISTLGAETTGGISNHWQGLLEPAFPRMANGLPDELEQIKQYGNAVVPQVVEWIARRIVEADR